uniref:Uncharacterized protein n=1 Tax=Ixodes ricinus TaxID=34613 RepID=A0A6B0V1A3_IXORI
MPDFSRREMFWVFFSFGEAGGAPPGGDPAACEEPEAGRGRHEVARSAAGSCSAGGSSPSSTGPRGFAPPAVGSAPADIARRRRGRAIAGRRLGQTGSQIAAAWQGLQGTPTLRPDLGAAPAHQRPAAQLQPGWPAEETSLQGAPHGQGPARCCGGENRAGQRQCGEGSWPLPGWRPCPGQGGQGEGQQGSSG